MILGPWCFLQGTKSCYQPYIGPLSNQYGILVPYTMVYCVSLCGWTIMVRSVGLVPHQFCWLLQRLWCFCFFSGILIWTCLASDVTNSSSYLNLFNHSTNLHASFLIVLPLAHCWDENIRRNWCLIPKSWCRILIDWKRYAVINKFIWLYLYMCFFFVCRYFNLCYVL